MTLARKKQLDLSKPALVHCYNRCVRRAWLCGVDPYSGIDYSHRKDWFEQRFELLSSLFSIYTLSHSVRDNHWHAVLLTDPQRPRQWSNLEVAERWTRAYPLRGFHDWDEARRQAYFSELAEDEDWIARHRMRLGNLSWFMSALQQPISRRANLEDSASGRFFEGRYKSEPLLDQTALLAAMVYVDLNPVRDGSAQTPEESDHTSIQLRIEHRQQFEMAEMIRQSHPNDQSLAERLIMEQLHATPQHAEDGIWLLPIQRMPVTVEGDSTEQDEAAEQPCQLSGNTNTTTASSAGISTTEGSSEPRKETGQWKSAVDSILPPNAPRNGILNMTVDAYIQLVEWTGRIVRSDKRGAIPKHLAPIMDRLDIDLEKWKATMSKPPDRRRAPWGSVIGSAASRAKEAIRRGTKWAVNALDVYKDSVQSGSKKKSNAAAVP